MARLLATVADSLVVVTIVICWVLLYRINSVKGICFEEGTTPTCSFLIDSVDGIEVTNWSRSLGLMLVAQTQSLLAITAVN